MAFAQSEGKSSKKAIFLPKKSRFFQSAITLSKIDEILKFFFFFENLESKLLKSVGFTRIGLELAIWR